MQAMLDGQLAGWALTTLPLVLSDDGSRDGKTTGQGLHGKTASSMGKQPVKGFISNQQLGSFNFTGVPEGPPLADALWKKIEECA